MATTERLGKQASESYESETQPRLESLPTFDTKSYPSMLDDDDDGALDEPVLSPREFSGQLSESMSGSNNLERTGNQESDYEFNEMAMLRGISQVKHWAETLEFKSKGKNSCQVEVEASDLAKLCRVVQWMHGEFEHVGKQARESQQKVTLIGAQVKNNKKYILQSERNMGVFREATEQAVTNMRDNTVLHADFDKAADRITRLERRLVDEVRVESDRLDNEVQSLHEVSRRQHAGLEAILDRLESLGDVFDSHQRRLHDEKNRMDNANFRVDLTSSALQEVRKKLEGTATLRPDIEQVARVVGSLRKSIAAVEETQRAHAQQLENAKDTLQAGGQGANFSEAERSEMQELKFRLGQIEHLQAQLSKSSNQMQTRIRNIKVAEADIKRVDKRIGDIDERTLMFERYVTEQLMSAKKIKAKDALSSFDQKWNLFKKQQAINIAFLSWRKHLQRTRRLREALRKTHSLYSRSHATARLRTWWYITQKDMVAQNCQRLTDVTSAHAAQIDTLQERLVRHEKNADEKTRNLVTRVHATEKSLELHSLRKADMSVVQELVDNISQRLERDHDLTPVNNHLEDLFTTVKSLQAEKVDMEVWERQRKKVLDLITELRDEQRDMGSRLDTRAGLQDLHQKAEAHVVEEVVVLLAKQADQLAGLVAADLERIRSALGRFLELSPDIRKAALGLGLEANERCVVCGPTRTKETEVHIGTDGNTYRVPLEVAQLSSNSAMEQARQVTKEKLQMPTALLSSLAVASSSWFSAGQRSPTPQAVQVPCDPARPSSAATSTPRPARMQTPSTVATSEDGDAALPKLRRLVEEAPGWSAFAMPNDCRPEASHANTAAPASKRGVTPDGAGRPTKTVDVPTPRRPMRGAELDSIEANKGRSYFPAVGIPTKPAARSSILKSVM